jgi:pimeloyl-ACP methyl ester carboxylesterase
VNVSCSEDPSEDGPVIVLMAGAGDPLDKLSGIQQTLSAEHRVCSYDRLGEGASDEPDGPQDLGRSGEVLAAVLDEVAWGGPVVLAGHSLGGLIAARYAPDHPDEVTGLVLLDATPPHPIADTTSLIPESATGPAADVRAQMLAANSGENPEKLVITDGDVRSAGGIPGEVVQHGPEFLTAIPDYGPDLERIWATGQQEWLAVSSRSTLSVAAESTHDIYVDHHDVAAAAIRRVVAEAGEEYQRPWRRSSVAEVGEECERRHPWSPGFRVGGRGRTVPEGRPPGCRREGRPRTATGQKWPGYLS